MSDAVEIILDHPVTFKGAIYRSLTVRPPTLEDRLIVDRRGFSKFGRAISMIARLCDVPKGVVVDLEPIDALKIDAFLSNYIGE